MVAAASKQSFVGRLGRDGGGCSSGERVWAPTRQALQEQGCSRLQGPLLLRAGVPAPTSSCFGYKGFLQTENKAGGKNPFFGTISKPGALLWFDRYFVLARGHAGCDTVVSSSSCSGEITSPSVNRWPCHDPGLELCACRCVHAGLGASVACGAGLKALRLTSNLVFGMSVYAVSEETGLPIDLEPQAPVSHQLLKLSSSGVISQKAHFILACCFRGWDHHKMLSPGMERAVAGLPLLGLSR